MTLAEMAEEYLFSAELLTGRIEDLLACRRKETRSTRIREINLRLKMLRAIRRENQNIADLLLDYYDKGGHIYEEYRGWGTGS